MLERRWVRWTLIFLAWTALAFRQFTSPLVFIVLLGIVLYARRPASLRRS